MDVLLYGENLSTGKKGFSPKENVGGFNKKRSSYQRGLNTHSEV